MQQVHYYFSLFNNNKGQTKKPWNGINQLPGKQPERSGINSVELHGTIINEPQEVANTFYVHFSEIAPKLLSNISTSNADFSNYPPEKTKIFSLAS